MLQKNKSFEFLSLLNAHRKDQKRGKSSRTNTPKKKGLTNKTSSSTDNSEFFYHHNMANKRIITSLKLNMR
jgi:hypothetical protein